MIPIAKPYITEDEARSAYETILSGWISQGRKVEEFEKRFSEYINGGYAVAVSNCTVGLHLMMIVSDIGKGDEVICPSLSYIATANSIKYVGAEPVFAEVEPYSYNIDINHAEKLITKKTKAILIVHQIGMPANIDSFKILCEKYNLKLLEDAACATGSIYNGKRVGSDSELACFSFHPRKIITTGEGGMITTTSKKHYERLKLLRQQGMSTSAIDRAKTGKPLFEEHLEIGYNYRMTDIQASIGLRQLEKLDWIIKQRREIALRYIEELKGIDQIILPTEEEGYISNYQSFCIYINERSLKERNDLLRNLIDLGIEARRGVMTSHTEPPYRNQFKNIKLPISEKLSDRSILIPLYVPMTENEIEQVIKNIKLQFCY